MKIKCNNENDTHCYLFWFHNINSSLLFLLTFSSAKEPTFVSSYKTWFYSKQFFLLSFWCVSILSCLCHHLGSIFEFISSLNGRLFNCLFVSSFDPKELLPFKCYALLGLQRPGAKSESVLDDLVSAKASITIYILLSRYDDH